MGCGPEPALGAALDGRPARPSRIAVLSLPDLVRAKKTQRDKDWPMIRRLVEADRLRHLDHPTGEKLRFWLLESRTPAHLIETAAAAPALARREVPARPLLAFAIDGDSAALEKGLLEEQERERALDREYWRPLREELEALRRGRR